MVLGRVEAGHLSQNAIYVDGPTARSAHQVMMVVIDAILIQGRGSGGLDSSQDAFVGEDTESVVYGLTRDRPDLGTHDGLDVVRRGMGPGGYRPHDREALGGYLDAVLAEEL